MANEVKIGKQFIVWKTDFKQTTILRLGNFQEENVNNNEKHRSQMRDFTDIKRAVITNPKKLFIYIMKGVSFNTNFQLAILIFLAIGLNFNTLNNDYAVDDPVVLTKNTLVEKGFNGIPELLTTNFFSGVGLKDVDLPAGRYRPIALITFAIEHQIFGNNPFISHMINILLFALLIALLYKVLKRHLFREFNINLAFITCIIFVVHPIHTEIIANVKSRDEIITFILLLLSSLSFLKHTEKRSLLHLFNSLLCFFLALLTRESAIPFLGLIPIVAYFFFNQTIKKAILISIPFFVVFAIYILVRISIVGMSSAPDNNILNSPFFYATQSEAFATKLFILLNYLGLLLFPHPLSFDYSYNQIPYIELSSVKFISSLLLFTGLIIYAVYTFKRRSIFSFCIFYFIVTIFLFSNFIINIGAPLAERLLFQPSLAFCIVVASVYNKTYKHYFTVSTFFLALLLLLFSLKTIHRNLEWKNDETLCFSDINSAPNSLKLNLIASTMYVSKARDETDPRLKNEYFKKNLYYDEKILKIEPGYPGVYEDLGLTYLELKDYFKAAEFCIKALNTDPENPEIKKRIALLSEIFFNEGNKYFRSGNTNDALIHYKKSIELNNSNVDAWYNLGEVYFKINDTKSAIEAWQIVKRISPNYKFNNEGLSK